MKPQTLVMLVIAVGCGLTAMLLTQRFLSPETEDTGDKINIVVANADIQPGTQLNEQMLRYSERSASEELPENIVTSMDELVGRSVMYPIWKGELMTPGKLADPNALPGLHAVVPKGMRAVTVPIKTDRALAGFIKANSVVDIILTLPSSGRSNPARATTLLQKVKILAVNKEMENGASPDTKGQVVEMVTFLLNPEESIKIRLGEQNGNLSLVLRSNIDDDMVNVGVITADSLLRSGNEEREMPDSPESIFLNDPDAKKSLMASITEMIKGEMKKVEPVVAPAPVKEETLPAPIIPSSPVVAMESAPPAKWKRLVYRDFQGNELFPVLLPADSKLAATLSELTEDVPHEEVETLGLEAEEEEAVVPEPSSGSEAADASSKTNVSG
ncbi:SAF domain protein [Planctomycetes bacterium Pan216]|uniref:SAF domain protein n=1 Tax=Kolteria novifilia TaxID=2527975 RepID=A0A518AYG8_9BACT|nr:SAF domain protein [Planctomycetes bacterium Pan216]